MIALDTRAPKEQVDHATLAAAWRDRAYTLGFGEDVRRAIVADAESRAAEQPTLTTRQRAHSADEAVAFAADKISEREATFSAAALEREAGDAARGLATNTEIIAAITRAKGDGALVARTAPTMATGISGYATREAIATEHRMLKAEAAGRDRFAPLHDRLDAARIVATAELTAFERGHAWTKGQRAATKGLLLSTAATTGVQGSAGTAKTNTVLRTYADAAHAQGLTVRALAPTASAADVLGKAIGTEPMTVAKMLIGTSDIEHGREVWIVDEASMLSARDADRILVRAEQAGARLVLVGDVDQLASVEAGRAFGQLQDHGMPTFVLDEIVRQSNDRTREAVEAILADDAIRAFAALDAGGGGVIEHHEDDVRRARIAQDFAGLSPHDRAATLVLDPTRKRRQQLTDAIRTELLRDGTLGQDAVVATVLEPCGLGRAERARATSYQPDTIVTFRKGSRTERLSRGGGYRVEAVDHDAGTVRLIHPEGKAVTWKPTRWGASHAEAFTEVEQEFRTVDRIQFTRNNRQAHRINTQIATVVALDPEHAGITVAMEDGSAQTLDLTHLADRHIQPGWVRTIHSAQGAPLTASWRIWRVSRPAPSMPAPPMSPSPALATTPPSTPTTANA